MFNRLIARFRSLTPTRLGEQMIRAGRVWGWERLGNWLEGDGDAVYKIAFSNDLTI